MEKIIIIKEKKDDCSFNLLKMINLLFDDSSIIECSFTILESNYSSVSEFKHKQSYINWIEAPKKSKKFTNNNIEILITANKEQLKKIAQFIKDNEFNCLFECNSIKLDINDNDGDLLIVNTRDNEYEKIRKIIEANIL